ncbi:MAG: enoyl-CoA hydratase/isomerase family protein [Acidimicrobiales bacterium]
MTDPERPHTDTPRADTPHPPDSPASAHLKVERHGAVTLMVLDRPEQRNALNDALRDELTAAVAAFDDDPGQRVGVLTGAGSAFCAGADLRELAGRATGGRRPIGALSTSICGVGDSPKPWVAAVNGPAVAGGLELALNCDVRIAAARAWFALPEVSLGLLPGVAVHQLARQVAWGDAMWLLVTGERVDPESALRSGLVQQVVGDGVVDRALELASQMATYPTSAVQACKAVARQWRDHDLEAAMDAYRERNRTQYQGSQVADRIGDVLAGGGPDPTGPDPTGA